MTKIELNPDGTLPVPYIDMKMTSYTCTNHEYTKDECLYNLFQDSRHLVNMRWWQDKKPVLRSIRNWVNLLELLIDKGAV